MNRRLSSQPGESDSEPIDSPHQARQSERGCLTPIRFGMLAAMAALICLAIYAYRDSAQGPHFYSERASITPENADESGERFEQASVEFHNELQSLGDWEWVIVEEELNGWLATHLPEKLPHVLPPEIVEPRVQITPDLCRIAFRVQLDNWQPVVVAGVEVFLTDEPNVIGVRIASFRSGFVPLPITSWTSDFAAAAARSGIKVRWSQDQGTPLALITLPTELGESGLKRVSITQLEQQAGQIVVRGLIDETVEEAESTDAESDTSNEAENESESEDEVDSTADDEEEDKEERVPDN